MSQTLASPRRPIINRFCERPDAGVIIRRTAVGTATLFAAGWLVMSYSVLMMAGVTRTTQATQEYGAMEPRGMAGRVSLASKETGR